MHLVMLPRLMQMLIDEIRGMHISEQNTDADSALLYENQMKQDRATIDRETKIIELAVDAVQAYASQLLLGLRQCRNRTAPIHRLPHEILSEIFQLADDRESFTTMWRDPHFHRVAGVSRLWRQVVRESPRLWKRIFPLSGALVDRFIGQSRQVPLEISFDHPTKEPSAGLLDYLLRVGPQSHRWRSCHLQGTPDALEPFLRAPAPMLEILDLGRSGSSALSFSHPALFAGHTPRLRELSLRGIHVPLDSSIYAGLTSLRLFRIQYTQPNSIHQLISILHSCPLLRKLDLSHIKFSFPHDALDGLPTQPVVELRRLEKLKFSQIPMAWAVHHILSRLSAPSALELDLELDLGQSLDEVLPQYLESQPYLQNLLAMHELEIVCRPQGNYWCRLMGKSSESERRVLAADMEVRGLQRMFSNLGNIFPLPLEKLFLSGFHFDNEGITTAFAEFLARHPRIKEISFSNCSGEFISTLKFTPTRKLCPLLQGLTINGCDKLPEETLLRLIESRVEMDVTHIEAAHVEGPSRLQFFKTSGYLNLSAVSALRKYLKVECRSW
ncbi:hypothetical protein BOTBODRAFT_190754 [Botryobasidium botryosum FD-172 SS1]|uniref:F-box domain-containing protein n=1 Tax=Botryobasidium botryosum (strain FD-172 SS1) TaxID=930990 RepID=A0A067M341_BOTB1|nr:hypothetical protein BOTBODRAFT_190754 [Botryobasidium botryosum FD-172 SS1]